MSILWDVGNYLKIKEMGLPVIKTGTTNMGNGVYLLRAGTPLNNSGAVANTGNAKYLVAEDFYFYSNKPDQAKLVKVIERGYVDLAKAQAAFGKSYTGDAKTALATAGVILVDGALEAGGGLPSVTSADAGKVLTVAADGDWDVYDLPMIETVPQSTAETLAALVYDFNTLLENLIAAGYMGGWD